VTICPSCGRENPDGFRFCGSCGAELAAETPAGMRKTVTVLFCDLVGSTALGERSDPEVLRELMASYHAALRTILERHGATVEKFVGDAAMAVFGIPHVHEDDALRAVRAAAEMRETVTRLGLEDVAVVPDVAVVRSSGRSRAVMNRDLGGM
jgi:class 3 adenylate cyclase